MLVCNNCVMDDTDPSFSVNNDGLCSHCTSFYKRAAKIWEQSCSGELEANFSELCRQIKRESIGKDYDCIVGLSGGLDSSYMLHTLVTKYNMRPLVFHVDAGWNTKDATQNIDRITTKLGVELFVEVVDWENMREVQKSFYKAGVSHLDTPQDVAFFTSTYNFAIKHDIKYIMNGGNVSTEGVMVPLEWMYYANDTRQFDDIINQFSSKPIINFPKVSILETKILMPYFKGVKVVRPLNSIRYIRAEAEDVLSKEYGFVSFANKHYESVFTRFNEGYWLPKRFNYDTRKITYSSLILTGQMTRHKAIEILKNSAMSEHEWEHEKLYIAKKLKITIDEFESYMVLPKRTFQDYRNLAWLYNLGAWVLSTFGSEVSIKK